MTRTSILVVAAAVVAGLYQSTAAQGSRPTAPPRASLAQPGISPDGGEIAFVSAGDIWVVPVVGGEARLLIAHAASDERPLYSPDGTRLAFISNRGGSRDIWILTLASGQLARLTGDDGDEHLQIQLRIPFARAAHRQRVGGVGKDCHMAAYHRARTCPTVRLCKTRTNCAPAL